MIFCRREGKRFPDAQFYLSEGVRIHKLQPEHTILGDEVGGRTRNVRGARPLRAIRGVRAKRSARK